VSKWWQWFILATCRTERSRKSKLVRESLGTSDLKVAAGLRCDEARGGLVGSALCRNVYRKRSSGYVSRRRWQSRHRTLSAREGIEILDGKLILVWKGEAGRAIGTTVGRAGTVRRVGPVGVVGWE